jgi:hypothetical protein
VTEQATALLIGDDCLTPDLREIVSDSCAQAGLTPVLVENAGAVIATPTPPALVIAALPQGQRFVPELAARIVTQSSPTLPLLLLCDEALVRYSVSLAGGRLTLVGQPLTRDKIAGRIRLLLAGHLENEASIDDGRRGHVREYRGREWWAGVAVVGPPSTLRDSRDLLPYVSKVGRAGFAGVVPLDLASPPSRAQLQRATEALAGETAAPGHGDPNLDGTLAALRFDAESKRWSFHWPREWAVECLLASPVRFPSRWRVQPVDDKRGWRHLPAAGGDIVLLCASGARAETEAALAAAGADAALEAGGGPALLDRLEAALRQRDQPSTFVVAEIR